LSVSPQTNRTALLFPGQGSHFEGMDESLRDSEALTVGLEILGYDPFERLDEGTRYQQPAVFLCSVATWQREGEPPAIAAAGHSLGEYAALVAAGAVSFADATRLVDERGAAMADACALAPSGMTAMLGGDQESVVALAARLGLVVANDNAPGQLVLAGPDGALDTLDELAREETGARPRRLDVGGAFHTPLMEPAAARLGAALAKTRFSAPRIPVYSNASAAPFSDPPRELMENLLAPVRWRETLLALHAAGADTFVELGPGKVLSGLVKRTLAIA
jgi:malonyl CoA-acyl carrier protein transacylase